MDNPSVRPTRSDRFLIIVCQRKVKVMNQKQPITTPYKIVLYFLMLSLGILTILAAAKSLFVSIDIDESYAVAQSFRLLKGDRLLADMWEPHQLSGYLSAVFLLFYKTLFGTTDSVVLFLRFCGTAIHLGIGLFLFGTLRPYISRLTNMFIFFLHFNFLAKWITLPEFELMEYWLFLLTGLLFFRFYTAKKEKQNVIYPIFIGIFLFLQMLNYPTMFLLYPIYLYGMFRMSRSAVLKTCLPLTLGAALPGLGFLAYLFSYMKPEEFRANLSALMSDPSHTTRSFGARMGEFGLEFLTDCLILTGIYLLCLGILSLIKKMLPKKSSVSWATLCKEALLIQIGAYSLWQIAGCILFDQNQFYLQERYLLYACGGLGMALYLARNHSEQSQNAKIFLYFWMLPGFVALLATLMLTNMSANVSYTKLFPAIFVLLLLYDLSLKDKEKHTLYIASLLVLGSLLVCKLLLIRVTGCIPVTIKAPLQKVTSGPLKGIYIHKEYANAWESNCALLREYCTAEDNLFYFGSENLLYLCTDAEISVASVQGTSVFNQTFLDYLDSHPEKYPTVVAVDLRYKEVYEYRYSPFNYVVADWIEQEYVYTEKIETPTMILYINR